VGGIDKTILVKRHCRAHRCTASTRVVHSRTFSARSSAFEFSLRNARETYYVVPSALRRRTRTVIVRIIIVVVVKDRTADSANDVHAIMERLQLPTY
jgi:hypothetical protein